MKICSVCQRCYEDTALSCGENHGSLVAARTGFCEITENYRLDVLLERDAAGETYRATHTALDQPFAVKIIFAKAAGAAENQGANLQSEARAAAAVVHPKVVRVYESGSLDGGDFYVVTEPVGGRTLREHLKNTGTLSEAEAVAVAGQTAEALAAAHAVGVIHRAVNPENIIINTDEKNRSLIKLQNFDFGAVRQQIAVAGISRSHSPIDALRYLSPEQFAREAVNARADVFSLGVVLYEMLCGQLPFDAPDSSAIADKQMNEQPLVHLRYDVRALLTYLLKQSLQMSQAARMPSASNLARQLRQIEQLITPPAEMRRTMPQTSVSKQLVSDPAAVARNTPAPPMNESPVENFQPPEIAARENSEPVRSLPVNQILVPNSTEKSEENAIDGDNSTRESPVFSPEQDDMTLFEARRIFEEREKSPSVEQQETVVASLNSELIRIQEKQVETFPRESPPPIVMIPSNSESLFIKNEGVAEKDAEKDIVETTAPEAVVSPVAGIKMREARQPAPLSDRSPATRRDAPKRFPLLAGAALLALAASVGLGMFLYNQRQESPNYEQAVAEESPLTVSTSESRNQSNEAVKNQAASENPAAEIEPVVNESLENSLTGNEQAELNSSLDEWITATNARDVERQMNYYAPKVNAYYRAQNVSLESVRVEKKRIFERADVVDIQTSKPEITVSRNGQSATMQFRKKYAIKEGQKSRTGEVIQELQWVKSGGNWKIVSERDVKVINR
jgi:serine/threonine-protein kinase